MVKDIKKSKQLKIKNFNKKDVKRSKLAGGILIAGIFLFLILILLILISLGFFNTPKSEKMLSLRDECSLVMGNVIHNIKDEGDCQIKCKNDCQIRDSEFVRVEFTYKNNSCHACDCYCK